MQKKHIWQLFLSSRLMSSNNFIILGIGCLILVTQLYWFWGSTQMAKVTNYENTNWKLIKENKAKKLILLGDVKHQVPHNSKQQRTDLEQFFMAVTRIVDVEIVPGKRREDGRNCRGEKATREVWSRRSYLGSRRRKRESLMQSAVFSWHLGARLEENQH